MSHDTITFITSNEGKLKEVQALLGTGVQGLALELPEIQDLDIFAIVEHKLCTALASCSGPILVDDTALYLECMSSKDGKEGLPGPLVKWFLHTIGNKSLAQMAQSMGNTRARACTVLGYADKAGNCHYFEGSVLGGVIEPQGTQGFGFDHIFMPDGHTETFARMGIERKNQISPRFLATQQLCDFLSGR